MKCLALVTSLINQKKKALPYVLYNVSKRHVQIFQVRKHFSQATVGVYESCWLYSVLNGFGSL